MLRIDPLVSLEEAFALALVRNQCRLMMTNDQREIIPEEQKKWFQQVYTQQNPMKYRVWLLKEETIIGYFAAKEQKEGFYITEGIQENRRGKGAGSFLLKTMLDEENFNTKPLFADIYNDNLASLRLHQKFGFIPYEEINQNLTRFYLRKHCPQRLY
jgi:L-amino acid N-acyltransferase YncA